MYDCEVIGGPCKKEKTEMNNRSILCEAKITVMYNIHLKKKNEEYK